MEVRHIMKARVDLMHISPGIIQAMLGLERQVHQAGFDHRLLDLVRMRASQINRCAYCLDMHSKDARANGETEQRLYGLDAWRETPYYSAQERAALEWTEALTLVTESHVPDEVYERVHVLLRGVVRVPRRRRRLAVALEHRVLLHVEVHRVDPAAAAVADAPDRAGALLDADERLVRLELLAVDEPLRLRVGVGAAALELERRRALHHPLPALDERLRLTQREVAVDALLLRQRQRVDAVVRRVVADDDLDHRDLVLRVLAVPHAAGRHLHRVDEVDDVALLGRRAVLVLGEVDHELLALGGPELERVTHQRVRQEPALVGDLRPLHALLGVGQAVLALQLVALVAQRVRGLRPLAGAHELELV